MRSRWVSLVVVVAVGIGFGVGWALATENRLYPYLPDRYSEAYTPSLAEWTALRFMAGANNEYCLTSRLYQEGLRAYAQPSQLELIVLTQVQPSWKVYLGNGRFACSDREVRSAYEEAGESVMKMVRVDFPEISANDVIIHFAVHDSSGYLGTWRGGKMTLEGEEEAE